MTEQTRKRTVYVIFAGAVILALFARPWEGRHRDAAQDAVPVVAAAIGVVAPVNGRAPDSAVAFAAAWPLDPFNRRPTSVPAVATVAAPASPGPGFSLQGVMVVNGVRTGVINGRTVRVGESIEGWRIVQIEAQSVRLVRAGETLDLHLP